MMQTTLKLPLLAADLFCGAGGTSTGILQAASRLDWQPQLLAVNHWPTAIATHSLNHPGVRHLCESLDRIRPQDAVPGGRLNLLAASPECTHHSIAAGGRPRNDQSRATAWHVCRWAADLNIESILIENVKEFQDWGPLYSDHSHGCKGGGVCRKRCHYGKPIPQRKSETFRAFIQALRSMNYHVDWRVVNAADYGDPTSRRRLLILARRRAPIVWPEPTHGPGRAHPYRAAREIIDWDLKGQSIFNRKKSLSQNTLRRIAAGLRKFGGVNAEPFLVMLRGTTGNRDFTAKSVDEPLQTVSAGGVHAGLVEPFLLHATHHGTERCHSTSNPLPTVTGANRGELALCEPFIVPQQRFDNCSADSVDAPLRTITTTGGRLFNLIVPVAKPFLAQTDQTGSNGDCVRSVEDPLSTIVTKQNVALVEPFVVKYYGTGRAKSTTLPLDTVTTRDRFCLVEPTGRVVAELDIRFRMLQPHELSAAMSFPQGYQFTGTKEDQVKQIGNAVPIELACAHVTALLT